MTTSNDAATNTFIKEYDCHTIHLHVHFTQDYTDMSVYGGPYADGTLKRSFVGRDGKIQKGNFGNIYPYNNKPNGLYHWIVHFLKSDDARRDEVVVLIDPDFLFLNKFEVKEVVLPGKPVAARYELDDEVRKQCCEASLVFLIVFELKKH